MLMQSAANAAQRFGGGIDETETVGRAGWLPPLSLTIAARRRPRAELSRPAGENPDRVLARRRDRHAGPADRPEAAEKWGQQVVVENRPGGGGNIGAAAAATAPPDGYTLHFGAQTLGTNVTLSPTTAFHPVTSFEPIMLVGTALEIFMVANETPFHSVKEVVDYAKANPGKLNYALGRHRHQCASRLGAFHGRDRYHDAAHPLCPDVADLRPTSSRAALEVWFTTAGGSLPHVRSGKVRGLAVNGPARSKLLPELPTMIELGINMKDEFELVRLLRAEGHAQGDHRQDQPRSAGSDRHAGDERARTGAWLPLHRRPAAGAGEPPQV